MSPPTCLWPLVKPGGGGGGGGGGRKRRANRYYYSSVEQGEAHAARSHAQLQKEAPACRRRLQKSHPPPSHSRLHQQAWESHDKRTTHTQPRRQGHMGTCCSSCQSADQTERHRTHRECESGRSHDWIHLKCRMWRKSGACLQTSGGQEN